MRYLVIILLLSSCSASWHLRRAQAKDPSLFAADTITKYDTIVKVDTAVIETSADTVFYYDQPDTVTIEKGNLQIKYVYKDRKVYLSGKSKDLIITKTITVNKETIIKKTITIKQREKWYLHPALIFFGMLIAFMLWVGRKLFTK